MMKILLVTIKEGLRVTQTPYCFQSEEAALDYMKNYASYTVQHLFSKEIEKFLTENEHNRVISDTKHLDNIILDYAGKNIDNVEIEKTHIRIKHGIWEHFYRLYDGKEMTFDRAKELLDSAVNYIQCGEKLSNAIVNLFVIGFTPNELIRDYNFSAEDVKRIAKEVNYREL